MRSVVWRNGILLAALILGLAFGAVPSMARSRTSARTRAAVRSCRSDGRGRGERVTCNTRSRRRKATKRATTKHATKRGHHTRLHAVATRAAGKGHQKSKAKGKATPVTPVGTAGTATTATTTATATTAATTTTTATTATTTTATTTTTAPTGAPAASVALEAISAETPGTPTAADPSGVPMPTGNLPGLTQTFSDDFTTNVPLGGFSGCTWNTSVENSECSGLPASVAAKWWAYSDGWPDTTGHGEYYPSQVMSIHDGEMDLYLHTANGIHMDAAPVPKISGTGDGSGQLYGAYVVRFKSDAIYGYKTAWLLWPDAYAQENGPTDGEIDFPEGDLDSTFSAYMHWMGATSPTQQDAYATTDTYTSWHTAVIEWTPSMVQYILDGQVIGTSTQHIPSTAMHWVLQTETSTFGETPTSSDSGHVLIDWVAAYSWDN